MKYDVRDIFKCLLPPDEFSLWEEEQKWGDATSPAGFWGQSRRLASGMCCGL